MQVLGIWDGHDAGVAWWRDGEYVCCLNEERISRAKRQAGFPTLAIETLISLEGLDPEQVDVVAIPGRYGRAPFRLADRHYRAQVGGQNPLSLASNLVRRFDNTLAYARGLRTLESKLGLAKVRARLKNLGFDAPILSVQHHEAHAHTAACAPSVDPLLVTLDGYGDGECGRLAPWTERQRSLRSPTDSIALVYGAITHLLGFSEGDEGKVMGLAAHGDPSTLGPMFEQLITPGACLVDISNTRLRERSQKHRKPMLQQHCRRVRRPSQCNGFGPFVRLKLRWAYLAGYLLMWCSTASYKANLKNYMCSHIWVTVDYAWAP